MLTQVHPRRMAVEPAYVYVCVSVGGSEDSLAKIASLQNAAAATGQKGKGKDKPMGKGTEMKAQPG